MYRSGNYIENNRRDGAEIHQSLFYDDGVESIRSYVGIGTQVVG